MKLRNTNKPTAVVTIAMRDLFFQAAIAPVAHNKTLTMAKKIK